LPSPSLAGEASPSSESPKSDPNRAGTADDGQVAGLGAGGQGDFAGSGDGGAHAEYGAEPAPFYPISARRSNEQGEVILRVLVATDGAVKRVEITQSSGFEQLDDSAIDTVSHRWRFEPAHRLGAAVESWVIVPIRFRLSAANAS
jgi:protein TonB